MYHSREEGEKPTVTINQQQYSQGRMAQSDMDKLITVLLVLILPPLGVWFYAKECNGHICLNICLCLLGWLPGIIHAIWYCFMRD